MLTTGDLVVRLVRRGMMQTPKAHDEGLEYIGFGGFPLEARYRAVGNCQ